MDKLLVRKDVYEELLEKGFGKKDLSKLTKKKITDKNGHTRTVYVRNGEQPAEVKQPKAQEGLTPEKKAKYEEMLEKVKAGSEENALFVRGEMLNKKDAIAHLEGKLGKKTINRAAQKPGIPIQGSNWISLPSGTRVTNEGAKEKMAKNNERIETLKKLMEGNTKADNIRLNSELRSLQNENEYIASRLPSDREEKKPVSSAAQGHLESDTPQNTDITAEDEERFGKQALSGLSGKREIDNFLHGSEPTPGSIMKNQQQKIMKANDNKVIIKRKYGMISLYGAKTGDHIADFQTEKARLDFMKENNLSKPDANTPSPDIKGGEKTIDRYKELYENKKKPSQDDMKENYLDAKNEGGRDIADENRIDTHSKNAINLNDSEVKKMQKVFDYIPENATAAQIMNTIYDEDKALYKKLSEMDIEYKKLHPEAEGKTFGFDLAAKYLEDSFNEYKKDHEVGKDKFAEMSVEDIRKEQQNLLDDYNQYYNAYKNGKNDGSKLREYFKKFDVYKTALDKKSKK